MRGFLDSPGPRAGSRPQSHPRESASGFTLLELLVAMFIVAVIFAMGYGAVNQGLKSRVELQEQQSKLLELQSAMRVLEQDFVQLSPRPVRQPVGDTYQPALQSTPAAQPLAALTHSGWTNPAGLQRPALQRVAYYFENGTMRREFWTVLDPTQTSLTSKRDLITHLKSVSLRYMDVNRIWQPQWPPATNTVGATAADQMLRSRPIAVEITLETDDWGKLVRIVEIPG